ncbi:unnamed protein product, partial [Durusdinium trenchii]
MELNNIPISQVMSPKALAVRQDEPDGFGPQRSRHTHCASFVPYGQATEEYNISTPREGFVRSRRLIYDEQIAYDENSVELEKRARLMVMSCDSRSQEVDIQVAEVRETLELRKAELKRHMKVLRNQAEANYPGVRTRTATALFQESFELAECRAELSMQEANNADLRCLAEHEYNVATNVVQEGREFYRYVESQARGFATMYMREEARCLQRRYDYEHQEARLDDLRRHQREFDELTHNLNEAHNRSLSDAETSCRRRFQSEAQQYEKAMYARLENESQTCRTLRERIAEQADDEDSRKQSNVNQVKQLTDELSELSIKYRSDEAHSQRQLREHEFR